MLIIKAESETSNGENGHSLDHDHESKVQACHSYVCIIAIIFFNFFENRTYITPALRSMSSAKQVLDP